MEIQIKDLDIVLPSPIVADQVAISIMLKEVSGTGYWLILDLEAIV